jgi:2-polyprenyl-6-methoxyphenol hydroxylase-like FAD-dependent oxidoreductase
MADDGTDRDREVPVLIAGGGLVGLSMAMFLAHHGVASVAVERLRGGSTLPRAAHFHLRTLELFRLTGISEEVATASELDFLPEGALIAMDSLAGRKLADIIPSINEGVEAVSPCRRLFVTQPRLEPILRRRAQQLAGAEVLEGHELIDLDQDGEGVDVTVRELDSGSTRRLRARYLVGADGAHSRVREILGIPFGGRGVFSNSITIYFTADVSSLVGGKPLSVIYINHELFGGFFRLDRACQSGFLVVNTVNDRADGDAAADISESRLIQLVRAGAGVADLDVRIDGVARWRATAETAQTFQAGRVFLAGDAAHLMPPNGGFGGNTGIHDAHNLAWKLALCLQDRAGPGLPASYDAERRPVAELTVEQAYSRYVTRTAPHLGTGDIQPVLHDFEIELGHRYHHSPAVIGGGDGPVLVDPSTAGGAPGTRAPHAWIELDGQPMSTIDLTGREFVLICGPGGADWSQAAARAAEGFGVDLRCFRIGDRLREPERGTVMSALGIEPGGASLIRPDGFVAWRSAAAVPEPSPVLGEVLSIVLDRPARR